MEAGYSEKVDELCERYSLTGFVKAKGMIAYIYAVVNKLWNKLLFLFSVFIYVVQKLKQAFHIFGICILMSWQLMTSFGSMSLLVCMKQHVILRNAKLLVLIVNGSLIMKRAVRVTR